MNENVKVASIKGIASVLVALITVLGANNAVNHAVDAYQKNQAIQVVSTTQDNVQDNTQSTTINNNVYAYAPKSNQDPVTVSFVSSDANSVTVKASGGSGSGAYAFGIAMVDNWRGIQNWYWQDNGSGEKTFTGLAENTTFQVFAYRAASSTHNESPVSSALTCTTTG